MYHARDPPVVRLRVGSDPSGRSDTAMEPDACVIHSDREAIKVLLRCARSGCTEPAYLQTATTTVMQALQCTRAEYFQMVSDEGLVLRASHGWDDIASNATFACDPNAPFKKHLSSSEPIVLGEEDFVDDIVLLRSAGLVFSRLVTVPCATRPRSGLLGIHKLDSAGFDEQDADRLQLLASVVGLGLDVMLFRTEATLINNITLAVNTALRVEDAFTGAIEAILLATGWACGEVWLPKDNDQVLEHALFTAGSLADLHAFGAHSARIQLRPGEDLAGRVWSSGRAEWIIDVSAQTDERFKRWALARANNLHSALCVPINHADRTIAVLCFLSQQSLRRDDRLVQIITDSLSSVALLISRKLLEQATQKLTAEKEQLAAIVQCSQDAIVGKTLEGIIITWNDGARRLYGYSAAEAIGRHVSMLYPEHDRDNLPAILQRIKSGKPLKPFETTRLNKDGQEICIQLTVSPVKNEHGEIVGASAIAHDLASRRQVEDYLREGKEQLEKRVQERTAQLLEKNKLLREEIESKRIAQQQARKHLEELARVSRHTIMGELASGLAHELNQPLCAIVNYTEACINLLDSSFDREELARAIAEVAGQAERAGEIVRRMRDFIRRREPELSIVDINEVIHQVIQLTQFEICEQKAHVELNLVDSVPRVKADPVQIQQVLINLIRNGLEAMHENDESNRVLAIQSLIPRDGDVEIRVADRGPGITAGNRLRIFDPFFSSKVQGMGMGLSISRSIIDAHRGRIWVASSPTEGARLAFTLPTIKEPAHE